MEPRKSSPTGRGGCASSFCGAACELVPSPSGLGMAHTFISACGTRGYAFKGHRFPPPRPAHRGRETPLPPGGGRLGWGKSTGPTPTRTLPVKGEGSYTKATRTKYPLSAPGGEGRLTFPGQLWERGRKRCTGAPVSAANRRLDFDSAESKIAPDKAELHAVSQSRSGPGRLPARWCWQG
jgi:hypothetical protein